VDPIGVLAAVLAIGVYPGGLFLALAAVLHRWTARHRRAVIGPPPSITPAAAVAVVGATVAAGMLPLTGSPALRLPPPGGVAGNLVAVGVLLAVSVDLGAGSIRASVLAAAAAVPVLGLAAAAGTVSVMVIAAVPDAAGLLARAIAAVLLVLAGASTGATWTASAVAAALALAASALVVPAALGDVPAPVAALACLAVVAASGVLTRWSVRWRTGLLAVSGAVAAGGGTVLALLSGRG